MHLARAPSRELRTWAYDSRRWAEYAPRESDIVIATYPKCGTTWMQRIVGVLVFQTPSRCRSRRDLAVDRFRTRGRSTTWWQGSRRRRHRRFLKAHLPFDGLPIFDEVKYIHVARDGRDALMSWHDHCQRLPARDDRDGWTRTGSRTRPSAGPIPTGPSTRLTNSTAGSRKATTADQADGLPSTSYFQFEATWWEARHRPNVLMVHYTDLKADLAGEDRRESRRSSTSRVPDGLLARLVEAAGFGAMQRDGEALLPHPGRFSGRAPPLPEQGHRRTLARRVPRRRPRALRGEARGRPTAECAAWLEHGGAPH